MTAISRHVRLLATLGALGIAVLAIRADDLPQGPGKDILENNCGECHGVERVAEKAWTKDKWRATVKDMVSRGAELKPEEIDTLVEYLSTYFGPDNHK